MSESEMDPLTAYLVENPPKDALDLRGILDGFMTMVNAELPEIGESIDDVLIRAFDGQDLTVDIHRPSGAGPFPILIYLHGGGWILGSPKTHRRLGHRFAEKGYLVFNVHYRLAPEAPFPAAYEDCVAALDWVLEHGADYGGDTNRVAMGGDSAGGNLSAAVATHADAAEHIKALLLIYPALDFATMNQAAGDVLGTGVDLLDMMVGSYIGHDQEKLTRDPRVSPIHAANKLPDALITCGTGDDLIEDCRRLEQQLTEAGKPFETDYYDGMPHGFCQLEEMFPEALESIEAMIKFLDRRLK